MAQPKDNTEKTSNDDKKDSKCDKHIHDASCTHDHDNEEKKQSDNANDHHHHGSNCQHNHSHSGGGCQHNHAHSGGCQHDHDHDNEMSYGTSLYQFIDKKNVKCLNESVSGAGKGVFKPYDERLDASVFVESDIDGELLFTVYFTVEVQLRSIQLTMNDEDSAPTTLKLWNDKQDKIDFDNHEEHKCSQAMQLAFDNQCEHHWKTKQHKFNDLTVLKMLFKKDDYD
eukprot:181902_1